MSRTRMHFVRAAICASHREPDLWMDFIDRTIGRDEYDRLKLKANEGVGVKFDWFEEREVLKALLADIQAAA